MAAGESPLPTHSYRVGGTTRNFESEPDSPDRYRRDIEPWLASVFQSEHFSLLLGSGFTLGMAARANVQATSMNRAEFDLKEAGMVDARAAELALNSGRGEPNIEDQLRAALQLIAGLEVLKDKRAAEWRTEVDKFLRDFVVSILRSERAIFDALESDSDAGRAARAELISFLLSFASRAASRERLHLFTTNYDRLVEYGCDLVGLRPLDRFVGALSPAFRASRLEVDMHYNPPGIRGEPRYLEGVLRLTKLHGSVDWEFAAGQIRRYALAFGAVGDDARLPANLYESLMIYPNPAKDLETLEYPYAELFRDLSAALCRPNASLVTYGYGFGDDHINRVMLDMLSIPSTHIVVISHGDSGGRLATFLGRASHQAQISLLLGPHFGAVENLVSHYLPKPAIDTITIRRAELERRRELPDRVASASEDEDMPL